MNFQVVSLFPEMIVHAVQWGVLGQALKKNLLSVDVINPRDFTLDRHKSVDDRPFGGGDGMIMLAEPLSQSIQKAKTILPFAKVIYISPQGAPLTDQKVQHLAEQKQLILLSGRYGGIDQRLLNKLVDEEISVGDFVLSGGEFAALALIDAVSRKIPGVLGHEDSSAKDSFVNGLLEEPQFTRPREFENQAVPEILLSGDHARIAKYKRMVSLLVTLQKRPDLFAKNAQEIMSSEKTSVQELHKFFKNLQASEREALGLSQFVFPDGLA